MSGVTALTIALLALGSQSLSLKTAPLQAKVMKADDAEQNLPFGSFDELQHAAYKSAVDLLEPTELAPLNLARLSEPYGLPLPKALQNVNLIVFGDSVDRMALHHLCQVHGENVEPAAMKGEDLESDLSGNYDRHVCNIPKYNTSILYRAHAGAMSVKPEGNWHQSWQGRNPMDTDSRYNIAPVWKQAQEQSIKRLVDMLPERPNIVLVQSSLWDSIMATKFLDSLQRPAVFEQEGLEDLGWKSGSHGLEAWDWAEKATQLMQHVKDSGIQIEKVIWRTNSNCPPGDDATHNFIDDVTDKQAQTARALIAKQDGPWQGVHLMDWRANFDARNQSMCTDGSELHYKIPGSDNYIDLLYATIEKAFIKKWPWAQ